MEGTNNTSEPKSLGSCCKVEQTADLEASDVSPNLDREQALTEAVVNIHPKGSQDTDETQQAEESSKADCAGKPEWASYKRIILCADGTWTTSNAGTKSVPSNVARIARAIANNGIERFNVTGPRVKQIVYYTAGLGATDMKIQKALYGAFGWGIDVEICQMYDFISNNYEPGDELFFFGFSRGAFTVRCVASLVVEAGILSAVNMTKFADMWEAYRSRPEGKAFHECTWYTSNETELGLGGVDVKVVGVWDTVAALRFPEYWWVKFLGFNKKYKFHDLGLSDRVLHAFQALALDEARQTFPAAVWKPTTNRTAELQQCWFPGIHGNIGGPDETSKRLEDIGDITFAWMVDNVAGMLAFEGHPIDKVCETHRGGLPGFDQCITASHRGAWGCQAVASNFKFFTGWFFRLLGRQDRTPDAYAYNIGESIHPIARLCKDHASRTSYPLKQFAAASRVGAPGYVWRKDTTISIPEYTVENKRMVVVTCGGPGSAIPTYLVVDGLSHKLCRGPILNALP